jgi:hypothetical protein
MLPELLWAEVESTGGVSKEALIGAEQIAGLEFTDEERELMLSGLEELREDYERLREVAIDNSVSPALLFDPVLPGMELPSAPLARRASRPQLQDRPADDSELAFLPVTELGNLLRIGAISSEELTILYIDRLKRFDPELHCVITLTEERAMRQARHADRELARGIWRGPLHGVPWGAKDLLAVRGYPTTWGAAPFKDQVIDEDAAVVQRLDEAGAVLVAKLTLGASPGATSGSERRPATLGTPNRARAVHRRGRAPRPPPAWWVSRSGPRPGARSCRRRRGVESAG